MLPDLDGDLATRAERRLHAETIVWLTTVDSNGQPQASPVGFVWDGATFLILSNPGAPKIRNLRGNSRVALHLDLDREAPDLGVLTIEGTARLDPAPAGEPARLNDDETSAYLDRHLEAMNWAGLTPEEAFTDLSTVIRVTPTRTRSY